MLGTIKTLTDRDYGFIAVDGQRDEFFHSRELNGVIYEDLRVGDVVTFEIRLVSREDAQRDIVRNNNFVLPYGEQKIVTPSSLDEAEFRRRATADLINRLSQNPLDLHKLTATQFEELVAELYAIDGYKVELLGSWNQADGGVDILAVKRGFGSYQYRTAIQCKRYNPKRPVSAAPIRALAGVLDRFRAHTGALVTTSKFTGPALKEASDYWRIDLVNYQCIVTALTRAKLLVQGPTRFSSNSSEPVQMGQPKMFRFAANVSLA